MDQNLFQQEWVRYTAYTQKYPEEELRYKAELVVFSDFLNNVATPITERNVHRCFTAAVMKIAFMRKKEQLSRHGRYCCTIVRKQTQDILCWMQHTFSAETLLDLLFHVRSCAALSDQQEHILMLLSHKAPTIPVRETKLKDFLN